MRKFYIAAQLFLLILLLPTLPISAEAEYCNYKLSAITKGEAKTGYGLVVEEDDGVPKKLLEITSTVETIARSTDGNFLEKFYSEEMRDSLSAIQCAYKKNPESFATKIISVEQNKIAPAIPQPTNVVAMGLNAKAHAQELGRDGSDGFIFSKNVKLSGAYDVIIRPPYSLLDYENELGIVIRKQIPPGTRITSSNVKDYIAGFVLTNDVTNRVPIILEKFDGGFTIAKTYPTFLPVGPFFVPIENFQLQKDELVPNLEMSLAVLTPGEGGETRQMGSTGSEHFYNDLNQVIQIANINKDLVAYGADLFEQKLLKHGSFEAGDLILMGTIAGIAMQLDFWKVMKILATAKLYKEKSSFNFFWPHYQKYFDNYGGPYPINQWEIWMRAKTHIARHEYCFNSNYLKDGQVVYNEIDQLGMQINKVEYHGGASSDSGDEYHPDLCTQREGLRWFPVEGLDSVQLWDGGF